MMFHYSVFAAMLLQGIERLESRYLGLSGLFIKNYRFAITKTQMNEMKTTSQIS